MATTAPLTRVLLCAHCGTPFEVGAGRGKAHAKYCSRICSSRATEKRQHPDREPLRFYSNEELLYRPLEHVLEDLSCSELGRAIGMGRSRAWDMKCGRCELGPEQEQKLRAWLALGCGGS